MKGEGDYRNVTATVRTPRCAILLDETSKYWMTAAKSAIAYCSEVWGGRYFLLIPTDGSRIKDTFWKILAAYNPDFLAQYALSFADLKDAEPSLYEERKAIQQAAYNKQGLSHDFEDWFQQSARFAKIGDFHIGDKLASELINRLSPFHFQGRAVQQHLGHGSGFGFPFTKIHTILPFAKKRAENVLLPKAPDHPLVRLLVYAETGHANEEYLGTLRDAGISIETPPEDYSDWHFAERALGRETWATMQDGSWDLPTNFTEVTPFGISSLHLGRYYRTDRHLEYREPILGIIGDTIEDFCLYYSLSRLHDGVYWLPISLIADEHRRRSENRTRKSTGAEPIEPTQVNRFARFLVNHLLHEIPYGNPGEKRIHLHSMSLSVHQLRARKSQVLGMSYLDSDGLASNLICKDASELSLDCIGRAMEENNHSSYQAAVFIDGTSVSPVDTPKPKNFIKINVPDHHWLTSLAIEGFAPPPIPSLGSQIVKLGGFAGEARVANDGLAYDCPNGAYFGGDVDVVTVRPKLALLAEMTMLGEYFGQASIEISYSDKGNYFLDTLRRFGGLEQAADFIRSPATRAILENYTSTVTKDRGGVIFLQTDQRAYLGFESLSKSVGGDDTAAILIDRLIGREVLERGIILQCERCRLASWYSVSLLTAEFSCNRCGLSQQFTHSHWKNPMEPRWYYKLAETVCQCYFHNSHLTIQVLDRLRKESRQAFHFAPEIDLRGFPKGGRSEIDIACILDGGVVIGECKKGPLHPSHVDKYSSLAARMPRRPDRLIFATYARTVSDEFNDRIKGLSGAEILTFDDLFDS